MLEKYFGKQNVYVGLLDLDKFKSVNDTHGHQTGDELIKATASRLDEVMGPDNLAARLGGDEFSFAFTETDPQAAEQRIQHLSDKLKEVVEFMACQWEVDGLDQSLVKKSDEQLLVQSSPAAAAQKIESVQVDGTASQAMQVKLVAHYPRVFFLADESDSNSRALVLRG